MMPTGGIEPHLFLPKIEPRALAINSKPLLKTDLEIK